MKETTKRICALDYGRGTMAAYSIECDAKVPTPTPLMDKDGEPSGFARMKDGTYCVGRQLYTMGARDFKDVEEIHLNVKEMPDGRDDIQVEYAGAWLRKIFADHEALFSDGAEIIWVIGCPTGWRKKSVIDKYRRIFEKAGFRNVIIVPESNAAMMFAQLTFEFVERMDKKAGVLCIDLGAYSADATYIKPGEVASHGGYVGASLIERMILAMNLSGEFCEDANNRDEVREAVRRLCETDADFRTHLLLQSKKLKETYFTDSANGADYSDGEVCSLSVSLQFGDVTQNDVGAKRFELVVTDEMATAITRERSIKSVLGAEFDNLPKEVQASLGDKTWEEALRSFIEDTLSICPDFEKAAKGKGTKPNLILTGGASLMPFVQETIRGMLPNIHLRADKEPMSTIAKGLAYFGPDKLKAMEFDEQFDAIASHDANGRKTDFAGSVLNKVLSDAHNILGKPLIESAIENLTECLNDAIDSWEGHDITSDEIVSTAQENFEEWFSGGGMKKAFGKCVGNAKAHIAKEINESFAPLSAKFGLNGSLVKASDIDLEYADMLLRWFGGKLEMFKDALEERDDMYSNIGNPSELEEFFNHLDALDLFTTSRNAIREACESEWEEDMGELRKKLEKQLKKEFSSSSRYKPFVDECIEKLRKALVAAKQMRLGELVVEDPFDEICEVSGETTAHENDSVKMAKSGRSGKAKASKAEVAKVGKSSKADRSSKAAGAASKRRRASR